MKILVNVKVVKGERCVVSNYRRNNHEEEATVLKTSAGLYPDGSYHVSYCVRLDRVTTGRSRMYPNGGKPLFLTVGDDRIERLD